MPTGCTGYNANSKCCLSIGGTRTFFLPQHPFDPETEEDREMKEFLSGVTRYYC